MQLEDFGPTEQDERLANLVTPYGVGSRSYNRSPEKREMDRQREAVTEKFLAEANRETLDVPVLCICSQRPYPHELCVHNRLQRESWNSANKFSWPWSLLLSDRLEPGT